MSTRESAAARAGVALASLDNILAGVRDYRKTAVKIGRYKKTLGYVDNFVRRLLVQHTRLCDVLEGILEEHIPTTGIDERIERNLKFRLGIFVGPFTDSVVDILDHIRNSPQLTQFIAIVEEVRVIDFSSRQVPLACHSFHCRYIYYTIPWKLRSAKRRLTISY